VQKRSVQIDSAEISLTAKEFDLLLYMSSYPGKVFTREHTIITLIFGSVAGALLIHTSKTNEREVTQRIHSELAQHVVDHYLLFKDGKPDREEAKKTFHDLMILGANFEFYLADKHGAGLWLFVRRDRQPSPRRTRQRGVVRPCY